MKRSKIVAGAALGGLALLAAAGPASRNARPLDYIDYINGVDRSAYPNSLRCGVFLGTGWWPAEMEREAPEESWQNPFTGGPFDASQDRFFSFGTPNFKWLPLELARATVDHTGFFVLTPGLDDLKGYSFDYIICHSDGCTVALEALNRGLIRAGYVFALGANWTNREVPPGGYGGAKIVYFTVDGDIVPKIPEARWDRLQNTPLIKLVWRFGGGSDRMVVRLRKPGTAAGAHDLADSYFVSILDWMAQGGTLANAIKEYVTASKGNSKGNSAAREQDRKPKKRDRRASGKAADDTSPRCPNCPPGCPPHCDGGGGGGGGGGDGGGRRGGGGGGGGGGTVGVSKQNPGGVSADIQLRREDFEKGTGTSRK